MTGKYLLLALLATTAFAQDPVSITPYQLLDARSGQAVACSGCSIYTYAAGTNTPLATYTSSTLATPNTNPVLTNSAGYAVNGATITGIWVGTSCYKFVAKDATAVTLFTQDNICDRGAVLKALLAASSGSSLVGFIQAEGGAVATTVQAAIRRTLSPKDFGAVGDCTTDDSAAMTLAVAASSGRVLDGGDACYALTTAVPVAVSNAVIQNMRIVVNRASPRSATTDTSASAFYLSGTVSQANVTIRNINFTGTGYWQGLDSTDLYVSDGWGSPGYPTPPAASYATYRPNILLDNLSFANPYYEAVFFTNVQSTMRNLRATGCGNFSDLACFESRYTSNIVFDGITITDGVHKGVSSSYAKGVKYSNINYTGKTNEGDVGVYVGYFNQDSIITGCSISMTSTNVEAGFLKVSYASQRTTVTGCTFTGTGYVMFQAARDWTFSNNVLKTSGYRGLRLLYGNEFAAPDLQNISGVISGNYIAGCLLPACSVVPDNGIAPRTVDLSNLFNGKFTGNNVIGNIIAYPAYDIAITDNMQDFTTLYATPTPAISLRAYNNAVIQGNRTLASFVAGTPTYFLNADFDVAGVAIKGNSFTVPTDSVNYGVQVTNSATAPTTGTFIYGGNTPLNQRPGSAFEMVALYTYGQRYVSYPLTPIAGVTSAIGGGALAAGACSTDNAVIVTGATTAMTAVASPVTDPGDRYYWKAFVSAANTATVSVCAAVAGTPASSIYRVKVFQDTP